MVFISILIFIVALSLPSLKTQLSPSFFIRTSSITFIYAAVLAFNTVYIQSIGSGIGIYSGLFLISSFSQSFDTFILLTASLILVSWPLINTDKSIQILNINSKLNNSNVSNNENITTNNSKKISYATEYSLIALFSTLGSILLVSSADLISMYLSIELQSFGLYILATLYREYKTATSAGLKYFLLGGLSSCFILLGSGLIYSFSGITNLEGIYSFMSVYTGNYINSAITLGFIIIIISFLFKIAAAPLHNWAPDVYDESPTIITIWLTIMPKIAILIFLLELQIQIGIIGNSFALFGVDLNFSDNIYNISRNLLLLSSLLSLIIGTVVGLNQIKIKRLLAYSTISHIGFLLLALAINSQQSIESFLFYIIQYTITNLNTFLIIIALGYIIHFSLNKSIDQINLVSSINSSTNNSNNSLSSNKNNNKIELKDNKNLTSVKSSEETKTPSTDISTLSEFTAQFYSNPLLALSLTICLFSMAGIPPLLGFFSKLFVLLSAISNGYYFISIVAIIASVISTSYYIKIIRFIHSAPSLDISNDSSNNNTNNNNSTIIEYLISNFHSFLISIITLSILLFFIKPSLLLNSTQLLSLVYFYL
jgi:NADH-ubiquinone oxidoreductase chain 2